MKRWLIIIFAAILLFCAAALAEEDEDTYIEVGEELSQGVTEPDTNTATLGTDIYLFVDPDSATYITFYVTDEYGNPIHNAQIYITVNGVRELYGVTNANGELSFYLFRYVEYKYEVIKEGYESASGTFKATTETRRVHVVLRQKHLLKVYVLENGQPVVGAEVLINGSSYITDQNGMVSVYLYNGEYTVTVITPDGTEVVRRVIVDGYTIVIIDLYTSNPMGHEDGGSLVYDRYYAPEDYVLTKYAFDESDLTQQPDESSEAFAQRVERYLAQHPNTLLVEAQPDRIQYENAPDEDVLDENGEPVYSQRSMMPYGRLVRHWEEEGFEKIVFTNEDLGLMLPAEALHSGEMMKAWAILHALTAQQGRMENIVLPEVLAEKGGLTSTGLKDLNADVRTLDGVDLTAVRSFEFAFDHAQEGASAGEEHELLPDDLFSNALFEFRITPVLPEELIALVTDGIADEEPDPGAELLLANPEHIAEMLRQHLAEGYLTEREWQELYAWIIDGRLTAKEIARLQDQYRHGWLTEPMVARLVAAALEGRMYRVSCHILYHDIALEVTELIDGLTVLRKADELYEQEFAEQLVLLIQAEEMAGQDTANIEITRVGELEAMTEAAMTDEYALMMIDVRALANAEEHVPGDYTQVQAAELIRSLRSDDEFLEIVMAKQFDQYVVDLRVTEIDARTRYYSAHVTYGTTQLVLQRALAAGFDRSMLVNLVPMKK